MISLTIAPNGDDGHDGLRALARALTTTFVVLVGQGATPGGGDDGGDRPSTQQLIATALGTALAIIVWLAIHGH